MSGAPNSSGAFEELFAAEHRAMVNLAVLLVGRRDVAEDIVQDAFAAVSDRWAGLDRPGAYLRSCVVNGSRMALRRQGLERRKSFEPVELSYDVSSEVVELHEALLGLSGRQRTVLVLRYYLDQPDSAIAEELGCSAGTVRSIAARSLRALRKELG